ncbi:DUF305 domain-containing protein [Rufibacter hautae]|uniref:DUF305 domain-containing protein n=1 Tax=Rufibacter hautae TaxID=2595005 RepID=A0A5B6T7V9_9BACT|nr:DUF305 domain-containing protein [Rufibacter hautae]KAA3436007.1 DUF305 domain-containing protein [Rufibacter hautae]
METNLANHKWTYIFFCLSLFLSACNQESGQSEKASGSERTEDHSAHDMQAPSSNTMMDLMHQNMTAMHEAKMTGDLDRDFAALMALHHEGALKMAQEEAENGQDTMLVNMAKNTLATQKEEQEQLQKYAESRQSAAGDTAASRKLMQSMEAAMADMDHTTAGTTDQHFAKLMGMHHQSGIDMAKAYLAGAKAPEIRKMAQKIIDEQQNEKQKLDNWLEQHPQ